MRLPLQKWLIALAATICSLSAVAAADPLVSKAGDKAIVPGWHLQSVMRVSDDMAMLSKPGLNTTHWYRVAARGTVMAGLIENGMYNDTHLFFSDNMESVGVGEIFRQPWLYREEFTINPSGDQHFDLITHGITSKADIYMNGARVASKEEQQGSYDGHIYNITTHIQEGNNCLLIRAYPTNYDRDFAQSFEDWNPRPADNGTGVWRNVEISQTGAVSMSPFRVNTDFKDFMTPNGKDDVGVTLTTDLVNKESRIVRVTLDGAIQPPNGGEPIQFTRNFSLMPGQKKKASIRVSVEKPQIWWPASWGSQPLYSAHATMFLDDDSQQISDRSRALRFGIRSAHSSLNSHNDTEFIVNGYPFEVLGAGYGPDIFLRYDENRVQTIFQYMLDMGLNTVRLEGKQEHPELYELADRMGMMILAGWECCTKWEGWEYNDDGTGYKWEDADYPIAGAAMLHEAEMMQPHPSMLGFLVGSDYWPNDRATEVYNDALTKMDWRNPIIASASKRGYPEDLGPSGMKMDGPYDWVPPNYWYGDKLGAGFGFGSELGSGVGTPEMGTLKRFMSNDELKTLWTEPEEGLYHMSSAVSSFYNREIYNKGIYSRYGNPKSLEDYILKCQMADYEATRAQFEAYSAHQSSSRPATGAIYWMLNSAWPNLHWQLFDYYLNPMGSYFGTKVGSRMEHVAYDYETESIWLINHSIKSKGDRQILVDLIDANGKKISSTKLKTHTLPTTSKQLYSVSGIDKIKDVAFLRVVLKDAKGEHELSRNVYWLSPKPDVLDWSNSTWYHTPVTKYADLTKLESLAPATVKVKVKSSKVKSRNGWTHREVELENKSKIPAVFMHLNAIDSNGNEIAPVIWSDNYITLWPREKISLALQLEGDIHSWKLELSGRNIKKQTFKGK
ncbi:Glycoside hydrolase family 2 N-terminal [Penicillium waksmanii]|uniref:Glycoside hydrolase family 2 N-terminal n=1 Tax=Penicillium waksmanii TaxID=69791 RepID=UPI0025475AF5|nr:Glycoside hydrolase family 2 N-terminal [Penicillium waksmanii]KAJ5979835.1 Glycoside hydrolase family 2 N-terminal [Penicillium waksmanii]